MVKEGNLGDVATTYTSTVTKMAECFVEVEESQLCGLLDVLELSLIQLLNLYMLQFVNFKINIGILCFNRAVSCM